MESDSWILFVLQYKNKEVLAKSNENKHEYKKSISSMPTRTDHNGAI